LPTFRKYTADSISAAGTSLVTCPSGQHFMHSMYVTNVYSTALFFTCELVHPADNITTHIAYNRKIFPGETVDIIKDNKIYLLDGDQVVIKAPVTNGFTVTLSLLEAANL
jgi:hypothetical protein